MNFTVESCDMSSVCRRGSLLPRLSDPLLGANSRASIFQRCRKLGLSCKRNCSNQPKGVKTSWGVKSHVFGWESHEAGFDQGFRWGCHDFLVFLILSKLEFSTAFLPKICKCYLHLESIKDGKTPARWRRVVMGLAGVSALNWLWLLNNLR